MEPTKPKMAETAHDVAQKVATVFGALPQVVAVALAGSQTTGCADSRSDIDLYIYSDKPLPIHERQCIVQRFAGQGELDNHFWEPADEWVDGSSEIALDIMYRAPQWIEAELERVLLRYEASLGCSTCLWHNVLTSQPLHDPQNWFSQLRTWADRPYPADLRRAIIAKNHPVLRGTRSSYLRQVEGALLRGDTVSIHHRVTSILASYFDILFALNRRPHPGAKRLVQHALASCAFLPVNLDQQLNAVLGCQAMGADQARLVQQLHTLLDGLDAALQDAGLAGSL
jgi:hypothetical protein